MEHRQNYFPRRKLPGAMGRRLWQKSDGGNPFLLGMDRVIFSAPQLIKGSWGFWGCGGGGCHLAHLVAPAATSWLGRRAQKERAGNVEGFGFSGWAWKHASKNMAMPSFSLRFACLMLNFCAMYVSYW